MTLILILASFAAHQWLDTKAEVDGFSYRENLTFATTVLNIILVGANAGMSAAFSLAADAVRQHTEVNQSSAPNYLIGCAVMSGITW